MKNSTYGYKVFSVSSSRSCLLAPSCASLADEWSGADQGKTMWRRACAPSRWSDQPQGHCTLNCVPSMDSRLRMELSTDSTTGFWHCGHRKASMCTNSEAVAFIAHLLVAVKACR